jgi:hypothetical protein
MGNAERGMGNAETTRLPRGETRETGFSTWNAEAGMGNGGAFVMGNAERGMKEYGGRSGVRRLPAAICPLPADS